MKLPKSFTADGDREKHLENLLAEKPMFSGYELDIELGINDNYYRYDISESMLKEKGFERHIFPWEYYKLLLDKIETDSRHGYSMASECMMRTPGCWFDMAVKYDGKKPLELVQGQRAHPVGQRAELLPGFSAAARHAE